MNRQAIANHQKSVVAVQLTLCGRVQGIGLRPAVARWAAQLDLAGQISNTTQGVELIIEGPVNRVQRFEKELDEHLPDEASISQRQRTIIESSERTSFEMIESETSGPLATQVPPDIAVCQQCLAEMTKPEDPRFQYPITSCTNCGPRYSIIKSMPYERAQTSMLEFQLCPGCQKEYQSPGDRRFHAQTNACPKCGPHIWCNDTRGQRLNSQGDAIKAASTALQQGKIIALRGLGGYQLLVDATSEIAVEKLRQRKHRYGKPLAVMVSSSAAAEKLVYMNESESCELNSPIAPIVLLQSRSNSGLANSLNAGLNTLGLMLPTTPLHWLLLQHCPFPLVVTSANGEGEPLAWQRENISAQLKSVADLWLEHDRPVERPIDDSVVRQIAGRRVTIRLARGLAPLPLKLESDIPQIASGGHQKAAFALGNGRQTVLGPHIGDLDSLATCERYQEQLQSLKQLYGISNFSLVCDTHPDYFTSQWAARESVPLETVQHHHAHVVAGMLEQGWMDRQVLGVAFDGTGWGDDRTIWGGEFLLSTATSYTRAAHLRPFCLPGGERAIREPWRVAVSLVTQAVSKDATSRLKWDTEQMEPILKIMDSKRLAPQTSSAGRLFDGVAALVMGITHTDYEGQAAMFLEAICDLSESGSYDISLKDCKPVQLDWRPLISQILKDRTLGVLPAVMAMRFHRGLARAIARLCSRYAPLPVVLGGGVFQNRCLVELLVEEFEQNEQPLGLPGMIPPNDGGLAAGQLAIAISRQKQTGRKKKEANQCA
ncbi:MAG: carbamoyltransferase HypF [Planctomycetes bacterium]|nr:carbamoyltransferase HypF [Planctomycetota bacterium]MCH9727287.1 carbamoyltransferase HypF [Planctomycetota bacterium]MCH9779145.1 carbamoyltransferase HypF [Planctomycetota bacterium]MCH9792311.1 carbamoyltransferase HypF [Planctomycetota bacterium]